MTISDFISDLAHVNPEQFSNRLKLALGGESINSFANRCGVSESLLRKYLSGSCPGLDKAAGIAKAAGVDIGWLATGEGQMRRGEAAAPAQEEAGQAAAPQQLRKQAPIEQPSFDDLGMAEGMSLLAKIYSSGDNVFIRAINANLAAFGEAVDNKAVAQNAIRMMEEMNNKLLGMENRLRKLEHENAELKRGQQEQAAQG